MAVNLLLRSRKVSVLLPHLIRNQFRSPIIPLKNMFATSTTPSLSPSETTRKKQSEEKRPRSFTAFGEFITNKEDAVKVFDKRFHSGSILEYNKILNGLCDNGDYVTPIIFFKKLLNFKREGTIYTFSVIMNCFCKMKLTRAGGLAVLGRSVKVGENPNGITYSTLLNGLIEEKLLDECFRFARTVPEHQWTNVMLSTLIKAFCAVGDHKRAVKLLRTMEKSSSLKPTVKTYGNLVYSLCDSGLIDAAFLVVQNMKTPTDLLIWNSLMLACCKHGRIDDARKVLKVEMPSRGLHPNLHSYTILINGLCSNGDISAAHSELQNLIQSGIKVDNVAFNSVASGYSSIGDCDQVTDVMEAMKTVGLEPDVYTYNSLLNCYSHRRLVGEAYDLFYHQMPKLGIPRDVVSCNIMMKLFFHAGIHLRKPMKLFNSMIKHDIATYHTLILGLCHRQYKRLDLAYNLFSLIKGFSPRILSFNVMMRGAELCGDYGMVENLANEVLGDVSIQPDVHTFSALIRVAAREGNLEKAVCLFRENHSLLDSEIFTFLVKEFVKLKDFNRAIDFVNDFRKFGFRVDLYAMELVLEHVSDDEALDTVEKLFCK